jgi:DNA-directed RNA polymerase specialized sigma24 family protein
MQEISVVLSRIPALDFPLNELWEQYKGGQLSRKDFEGRTFQFLLDNYRRFRLFGRDEEAFTDYLCWLYPHLSRAIDTYKEVGASFDAYISTIVRLSFKDYRNQTVKHSITERAYWETRIAEDLSERECIPAYLKDECFKPVKNPRTVLILLLKSYCFVSDDFIARVAPAIGISPDELARMIDKVRELRKKRDEEFLVLQEKLSRYYYRCAVYQKQLKFLPEAGARREAVCVLLKRAKARLADIRQELSVIKRKASNRQVATVLGISKNTVDSRLHAIKHKAAREVYKPHE